jgi:hypothetical protein
MGTKKQHYLLYLAPQTGKRGLKTGNRNPKIQSTAWNPWNSSFPLPVIFLIFLQRYSEIPWIPCPEEIFCERMD